jgi:hypothetical protein
MSGLFLLPLIGCWVESGGEAPESRFLYGVSGNLVLRRGEDGRACEGDTRWSEADEDGARRLRLNARWTLVENARTGDRYLVKDRERYALPACCARGDGAE